MVNEYDIEQNITIEISWHEAITEFILTKESEGYERATIKNYKSTLERFKGYCVDNHCLKPSEVNKGVIKKYLLIQQANHSNDYVNAILSKIRVFYDFLCYEEYLKDYQDPTLRLKFLKKQKKLLVVFNDNEVLQMIHEASKQKNQFYAERDKLIITILADCGLRVNELVNLRNQDVTQEYIFIAKAKGKKQRMVYVTKNVAKQVMKYKRVRDAFFKEKQVYDSNMFFRNFRGEHMKNDGVQKMLKRIGAKCDIRKDVRISPHTFRHWFAQSQLKNGISIYTLSKLLGHDSINTTQVYLNGIADEELVRSAIETSPLLNLK